MKGWSGYQNSPMKQTDSTRTRLKGEYPDLAITGGSKNEEINDIEDRIEFLQSDIADSDDDAQKATMKKAVGVLQRQLAKLRQD
jgi:hypothetical protein